MKLTITAIARICHEANKAYCEAHGDTSQVSWEQASPEIQYSAKYGVKYLLAHFVQGILPPPSALHDSWARTKTQQGWVYGEQKSEALKTHPCLVPFDKLPPLQQGKDILFNSIVLGFFSTNAEIEIEKIENPASKIVLASAVPSAG